MLLRMMLMRRHWYIIMMEFRNYEERHWALFVVALVDRDMQASDSTIIKSQ